MGVGIHWRINWRERYGSVNTSHFPTILENTFLWGNQAPAFVQKNVVSHGKYCFSADSAQLLAVGAKGGRDRREEKPRCWITGSRNYL